MSLLLVRVTLWVAVLLVLVATAGIDLRRRIIPNELVALVAVGGVALNGLLRPGSILLSLLFCLVVLLALLVFAHFNVLGAGDAKLIAAATLLVPPERIGLLLLAIALAGGLLSGVYLVAFQSLKHARAGRRHGAHLGPAMRLGPSPNLAVPVSPACAPVIRCPMRWRCWPALHSI